MRSESPELSVLIPGEDSQSEEELEEGECSQNPRDTVEPSTSRAAGAAGKNADLIDQRINSSLSKFQDYFEQKFENMSCVADLERQLAENKCRLELKNKGSLKEAS